jgi:ADP-ribose pyrophosphatase YjhB (NUDIX family)
MDPRLAEYLARCAKVGPETEAVWGNGSLPLRIRTYLTTYPPPLEFVNSVRSLVFRRNEILVLRNRDGLHIVPGGRREIGETLEETVAREVLEESGWKITWLGLLGLYHFHHLSAKPTDYPYLYPDFLNVVYVGEAMDFVPEARLPDEYEIDASFHPIEEVLALNLPEQVFLDAAWGRRPGR